MAQWRKKFEKWKDVKSPVGTDEVTPLLKRIFGERLQQIEGTSHQFKISVPELASNPKYQFGTLPVPVHGGQTVKAPYLQKAYEAAVLLELFDAEGEEASSALETKEDDENE